LLADVIFWIIFSLITNANLANSLFWLGMLGIGLLATNIHRNASIESYFGAIRLNENTIEIKVRNTEYENLVRKLNNIEMIKESTPKEQVNSTQ
jgi:hypothetical protein